MSRALALILSLALAACTPRQSEAEKFLRFYGLEPISVTPADWWSGPCGWSEPYSARFLASTRAGLHAGVICATGELAEGAKLRALQGIGWERESGFFEGGR